MKVDQIIPWRSKDPLNDKKQIKATFVCHLSGSFQLLYQGKMERSYPRYEFLPELDVWHSPNHWSNQELTKHFVEKVIVPYVSQVCQEKFARRCKSPCYFLFLWSQWSCFGSPWSHHIEYVYVTEKSTDRLQPLDVSVNKSVKDYMRRKFCLWYAAEVCKQLEQGIEPENVTVDTRMSVIKEISASELLALSNV